MSMFWGPWGLCDSYLSSGAVPQLDSDSVSYHSIPVLMTWQHILMQMVTSSQKHVCVCIFF